MDWRSYQRYSNDRPGHNFKNSISEREVERDFDGSNDPEWITKLIKKKKKNLVISKTMKNYTNSKANNVLNYSIWLINSTELKPLNSAANFFAPILISSLETDLRFNIRVHLNKSE